MNTERAVRTFLTIRIFSWSVLRPKQLCKIRLSFEFQLSFQSSSSAAARKRNSLQTNVALHHSLLRNLKSEKEKQAYPCVTAKISLRELVEGPLRFVEQLYSSDFPPRLRNLGAGRKCTCASLSRPSAAAAGETSRLAGYSARQRRLRNHGRRKGGHACRLVPPAVTCGLLPSLLHVDAGHFLPSSLA